MYIQVAVATPLMRLFDYLPPVVSNSLAQLQPGMRVLVPFGKRQMMGIIVSVVANSKCQTTIKPITSCLDEVPCLPNNLLQLIKQVADYYHYSYGELLVASLPTWLRQGKCLPELIPFGNTAYEHKNIILNAEQRKASEHLIGNLAQFNVTVLNGVTGSGKTEVYFSVIEKVLQQQQQVLVLVPEINLTPQTLQRFEQRFAVVTRVLHSRLTAKQRAINWAAAQRGAIQIIIGTRSAIFTPLPKLGLIIVDEEHDNSFKQQDKARFNARDVAIMRGKLENIPVILGSATPSFETLANVKRQKYQMLHLTQRANNAMLPKVTLVDMRPMPKNTILSPIFLATMHQHLLQKKQIIIFINRRGYAPIFFCAACNKALSCPRCDLPYVYHQDPPSIQCHHCGAHKPKPKTCVTCQQSHLIPLGVGTQRIHDELLKLFPATNILRMDKDSTTKKGQLETILATLQAAEPCILLGTQMLSKGHDFPHVTLVGIINADNGLYSADFRANEKLAQLLLQVSGRAGRGDSPGEVIIQTLQPHHPFWETILNCNYAEFAEQQLKDRKKLQLPPFAGLAIIRAEAHKVTYCEDFLLAIVNYLKNYPNLQIHGPTPTLKAKRKGKYTLQVWLHAAHKSLIQQAIAKVHALIEKMPNKGTVRLVIDVDPYEIL